MTTRKEMIQYGINKFTDYLTNILSSSSLVLNQQAKNKALLELKQLKEYPIEFISDYICKQIWLEENIDECYKKLINSFQLSENIKTQVNESEIKSYIVYFRKIMPKT